MLATLMFTSKLVMEFLPNIHLLGMFIMVFTITYRVKALIPIYIFVFLMGLYGGFTMWWVPYLYIWTILWGIAMLLPENISPKIKMIIYPVVCCLHGLLYGVLYAPCQALMFHFSFEQTLTWIASGFYFDLLHGIGNFITGLFILPFSLLLKKLNKLYKR